METVKTILTVIGLIVVTAAFYILIQREIVRRKYDSNNTFDNH